ncbi:hypothetical protein QRX50_47575 [Amycolatopsis carbonis]|uniref:Uncharacterized protein n=1 Tax=Amycolatopsis carbonis TaxID=715471 RepID=A0A9Y2MRW4_9PSEU|nr:hypothetical protein [Amycolatopsis sp. 2-15]WIX78910.1 hypothetical protein QRX50_47575 [Amycolatopsis sp. 2-15]
MIPHHVTEHLVAARQSELRTAASRHRATAAAALPRTLPTATVTARQRLGWLLVQTGLRLVTDRGRRPQITLPA